MKKILHIVRGLPGSGKSTKSRELANAVNFSSECEADDYFITSRGYEFNPKELPEAHAWCKERAKNAMATDVPVVIVSNTSSQLWEFQPYLDMAKKYGYTVKVNDIFDGGKTDEELAKRNVHKVPLEVIKKMRARWEK